MTHRARQYRTIWISDVHLGTRGCKAEFLLDFLRCNDARTIYLAGDIVDGWRLRKSWYWPQSHNDIVQETLRKVRHGTRVIYVPGNHDEWLRDYVSLHFGGIEVVDEAVHVTADGRRLLVIHGDWFDLVVTHARWLALLGDHAYTLVLWLNHHFNKARRLFGYDYWSLSAFLKLRVKNAVQYIGSFADALSDEARRRDLDGVVCGHIHHAEIRDLGGVLYCNDGDWVESCTRPGRAFRRPAGDRQLDRATSARTSRRTRQGRAAGRSGAVTHGLGTSVERTRTPGFPAASA